SRMARYADQVFIFESPPCSSGHPTRNHLVAGLNLTFTKHTRADPHFEMWQAADTSYSGAKNNEAAGNSRRSHIRRQEPCSDTAENYRHSESGNDGSPVCRRRD